MGVTVLPASAPPVPAGSLTPYALPTAPAGWQMCDGTALTAASDLRTALIAAGNPFGVSGSDPRVPDLRGRAPIGAGTGTGLTNRVLGTAGGTETHALTTAQLPAHAHSLPGYLNADYTTRSYTPYTPNDIGYSNAGSSTNNQGSNEAHPNMQPYLPVNYIIKLNN